jgi:hypothetical protein
MKISPIIPSHIEVAGLVDGQYGELRHRMNDQLRKLKPHQNRGELCLLWVREGFGQMPDKSIVFPPMPHEAKSKRAIYLPRKASRFTLVVTAVWIEVGAEWIVVSFRCFKENVDKFINQRELIV